MTLRLPGATRQRASFRANVFEHLADQHQHRAGRRSLIELDRDIRYRAGDDGFLRPRRVGDRDRRRIGESPPAIARATSSAIVFFGM